jgi:excisionase family DNA binding protein
MDSPSPMHEQPAPTDLASTDTAAMTSTRQGGSYPTTDHVGMGAPELLDKRSVAARLGVSQRTLARLVAEQKIATYRVGPRCLRFSRSDVEEYLESIRRPAAS